MVDPGLRHVIRERYAGRAITALALAQQVGAGIVQIGMGELIVPALPRAVTPFGVCQQFRLGIPAGCVDQLLPHRIAVLPEDQRATEIDHRGR